MKFELKTENDYSSKSAFPFLITFAIITFLIILSSISIKLGRISRYHDINFHCKMLLTDKTTPNFKKLSRFLNQNSKQRIWNFCKEIVK